MDEHRAWGSDGRIIEQTVGRGDGTGTRTTYDERGEVASTVEVKDLPVVPPEEKVRASIEDRLRQALDNNRTYLALPAPTAAQQRKHTERLTRQTNALIRQVLGLLDTDDTGD